MDGFTYHNIFETKGIEYLVVIAFLLLLIPFWIILGRKNRAGIRVMNTVGEWTGRVLNIPGGIFLTRNHTWAFLEQSGDARVGIDDLLLQVTGDIKVRMLKKAGDMIQKGEPMAELFRDGKLLKVFAPVTGEISALNSSIADRNIGSNDDPYNKAWMYLIKPENWKSESQWMLLSEEASNWLKYELAQFKEFFTSALYRFNPLSAQTALQDGGELKENVLEDFSGEVWEEFEAHFLKPRQ